MDKYLKADEIECRVGQVNKYGIMLLLYIDARAAMKRLDEKFGVFGWKRRHIELRGKEYCEISVKDPESKEWVNKMDCGTPSNTEKEKGESSDSFKRACVNWGIGRELYTATSVFIKCKTESIDNSGKRYKQSEFNKYKVDKIAYDENGNINELDITDKSGKIVYSLTNANATYSANETKQERLEEYRQEIWRMILDACNNDEENAKKLLRAKTMKVISGKRVAYSNIEKVPDKEIKELYDVITDLYSDFKSKQ